MARGKMPPGARGKMIGRNERLLERLMLRAGRDSDRLARAVRDNTPEEPAPIPAAPGRDEAPGQTVEWIADETRPGPSQVLERVHELGGNSGLYLVNQDNPITREELADSFRQWVNEDGFRATRFFAGDVSLANIFFRVLKDAYDRQMATLAGDIIRKKLRPEDLIDQYEFQPASVLERRQKAAKTPPPAPAGKRRYDLD